MLLGPSLVFALLWVAVSDATVSLVELSWSNATSSQSCTTAPDYVVGFSEDALGQSCAAALSAKPSGCTSGSGGAKLYACTSADSKTLTLPSTVDQTQAYLLGGYTVPGTQCTMSNAIALVGLRLDSCIDNSYYIQSSTQLVKSYGQAQCRGDATNLGVTTDVMHLCQKVPTNPTTMAEYLAATVGNLVREHINEPTLVGVAVQKGGAASLTSGGAYDMQPAVITTLLVVGAILTLFMRSTAA